MAPNRVSIGGIGRSLPWKDGRRAKETAKQPSAFARVQLKVSAVEGGKEKQILVAAPDWFSVVVELADLESLESLGSTRPKQQVAGSIRVVLDRGERRLDAFAAGPPRTGPPGEKKGGGENEMQGQLRGL